MIESAYSKQRAVHPFDSSICCKYLEYLNMIFFLIVSHVALIFLITGVTLEENFK